MTGTARSGRGGVPHRRCVNTRTVAVAVYAATGSAGLRVGSANRRVYGNGLVLIGEIMSVYERQGRML